MRDSFIIIVISTEELISFSFRDNQFIFFGDYFLEFCQNQIFVIQSIKLYKSFRPIYIDLSLIKQDLRLMESHFLRTIFCICRLFSSPSLTFIRSCSFSRLIFPFDDLRHIFSISRWSPSLILPFPFFSCLFLKILEILFVHIFIKFIWNPIATMIWCWISLLSLTFAM